MHGKPNAKLVPARHLDGLFDDGAGFAGFAAGDIGQQPNDPDLAAMPDVRSLHAAARGSPNVARLACDVHVEGEEWPYCPRTILRRQLERARSLGYEFKIGAELEYFLVRRREDGAIEVADALDTLDQPCYDMRALTRNLDFVSQVVALPDAARLGQLRHRPRGRERPVRAELRLRRRADHLRPRHLLPLHGRVARPGARPDRDLHAEAVRAPDRQRLPLPHEPLEGRRERVRGAIPATTRAASGSPGLAYHFIGGLKAHAKAYIALTAPDGQLLQAPRGRHAQRLELGARVRQLRLQQPHADAAHPGGRAHRGPHRRRLLQPLPGRGRGARRRPRRDRARARPGRADHRAEPARADRRRARASSASSCCPATCSTPRASSSATTCCARRSATPAREDYLDYFVRIKREEFQRLARPGQPVGGRPLPAAVLSAGRLRAAAPPPAAAASSPSRPASRRAGSACRTRVTTTASATTLA